MTVALKLCGLIDSLAPGGAQRQFVELMTGLSARKYEVTVIIYHRLTFFLPQLEAAGINVVIVDHDDRIGRIFGVRRTIAAIQPHLVISFLNTPNLIAELCKITSRGRYALIVSERVHNPAERRWRLMLRLFLHSIADHIVSNSHAQREHLVSVSPSIASKISTIHNSVDCLRFNARRRSEVCQRPNSVSFVVVASYIARKNPIRFVEAVARLVFRNPGKDIRCDWYGDPFIKENVFYPAYLDLAKQVTHLGLGENFRLHPTTKNVELVYQNASALCLPSLAEGCANAICEAMACGLPILASRVGDNPVLVTDKKSGILFDPMSVEAIEDALQEFCDLPVEDREMLGTRSGERAKAMFAKNVFIDKWETLIRQTIV